MQNISLKQTSWAEAGLFGCPGTAYEILKAAGIKQVAVLFYLDDALFRVTANWSINTGEAPKR
jgi:hypothetical protein